MVAIYYENRTKFVTILFVCLFLFFSFFVRLKVVQSLKAKQNYLLHKRVRLLRHHFHNSVPPQCHHMSFCGLRGPPTWAWQECNRLLRLGRPWGAVTLSRWCVSGDRGGCSAGGALNLNSTNLPRPWSPQESSPSRKIPTVEPGIEPGTSRLVIRDSDH